MNLKNVWILSIFILFSCNTKKQNKISVQGTWKLISETLISGKDTVVNDYTKNISSIKIINNTHFAFLNHDLNNGKNADSLFVAGGGTYTLIDSVYTEHLEYCSDRQWEGNSFSFTVLIKNDTLIQSGIEKIESKNIHRLNIEKYIRLTQKQKQ